MSCTLLLQGTQRTPNECTSAYRGECPVTAMCINYLLIFQVVIGCVYLMYVVEVQSFPGSEYCAFRLVIIWHNFMQSCIQVTQGNGLVDCGLLSA